MDHGSETYFVIGEGVLGEALGGREAEIDGRLTALTEAAAAVPQFRFSRLGPKGTGKQLGKPNRLKIAEAMTVANVTSGEIPAGFTYLGQFLDHDLTFDKSVLMEGVDIAPASLKQFRSPSLDLDSLYGNGPQDPGSAQLYEGDGIHLKSGAAAGGPPGSDLPRDGTGLASIGDERNDENLAVAQIHAAFIRFHNRVVDTVVNGVPAPQRFREARKVVTKHYQWMVRTDYLPLVCTPAIVTNVFTQGRKAFEVNPPAGSTPTMPVEFSVAAYRLGHSMIRDTYEWNNVFRTGAPNKIARLSQLFEFTHKSGGLPGPIPNIWAADFRRLFKLDPNNPAPTFPTAGLGVTPAEFNKAMKIDTRLANPLKTLPIPDQPPENNLAFRNLLRANMVKLATGQQMVSFLQGKGIALTQLTPARIRDGNGGATLESLNLTQKNALVKNTPLWFYILREAEFNNGRLGPVGSRIVAETFHRAMQGSTFSIVRDTAFRPSLGPNNTTFRMADLLLFAFNGQADLLNPNGP
jgi:Animal haem peroxidase